MARRMAYFSDVSGTLIDESERAVLTIKRPDGTTVTIEGSESELKVQAPPKRDQQLASVRVTYPGVKTGSGPGAAGKRKETVSYRLPVSQLRQVLPVAVIQAIGNMDGDAPSAPRANTGRSTRNTGRGAATEGRSWACPECERTFSMRRGLTRHLREGHQLNDRQIETAMEGVEQERMART